MKMDETFLIGFIMCAVLIVVLLIYFLWRQKKQIRLKDEKIEWLRRISAENDHRHNKKATEDEKQIIELTHKISILESRIKEGTKNQVVAKIESLKAKRDRVLNRAGVESGEPGNG